MKQVLANLSDGKACLVDVPRPEPRPGQLLIRTAVTLISAGTERMLLEFGRAGWLERARQQPEKVGQVLEKARTDGIAATIGAVQSKLDQPWAPGYCNVGRVVNIGAGDKAFQSQDRVVCNGPHAEWVCAPSNLCARIPDAVSDEQATFAVLGAIGLQGIRLANPTLGECVAVIGLGLIGQLTVQMLRAQGCRVLGIDIDPDRLELARRFGAEVVNASAGEDVLATAHRHSRGYGMDVVIIAAATKSNEPLSQAARMCRKRGRIVLVGVAGLELSRADFYEKELSFQVSCSYGPGRYDPNYEEGGHDYPIGFVRWTEQRNFEAVLDLMASGQLDAAPLVTHRFACENVEDAYSLLTSETPSLGIILQFPAASPDVVDGGNAHIVTLGPREATVGQTNVAFLGAGNFAGRLLMPAFKSAGARLHTVVSSGGVSAVHYGKKFGFGQASTNCESVLADPDVDTVVVATRHDLHARQVLAAMRAGKHVFCEKPLCLTLDELAEIEREAGNRPDQLLMLGFNRRFAPHVVKMKSLLTAVAEPKCFSMMVNAGQIESDHWIQDRTVGGGRIIGEACHFVDLLRHLAGAPILRVSAVAVCPQLAGDNAEDKSTITIEFVDGSIGTIHYFANGHKGFPKERLEIFCAGRVLQLDNFRKLRGWGWKAFSRMGLLRQEKGHRACAKAFVDAVRTGGPAPIPAAEIFEVSRTVIQVANELRG